MAARNAWGSSLNVSLQWCFPQSLAEDAPPRCSGEGGHPEVVWGVYNSLPKPLGLTQRSGACCLTCWFVDIHIEDRSIQGQEGTVRGQLVGPSWRYFFNRKGGVGVLCPCPTLYFQLSKTPFVHPVDQTWKREKPWPSIFFFVPY